MSFLRSLAVLLYSLAIGLLLVPLLKLAARWSPKVRAQLADRPGVAELARAVAPERARKRHGVLFFVSSAGEYEQARPLLERLAKQRNVYAQVLFFSKSGLDYAKARGETAQCALAPATDSLWHWGWLFAALRPDVVVVVRHELWPGFLETARHYARALYLIDASKSLGEAKSPLKRLVKSELLRYFTRIHCVSEADVAFFRDHYGLSQVRLAASGDTKYDRVRERAVAKKDDIAALRGKLDAVKGAAKHRLVVGSAHPPDLEVVLGARGRLPAGIAEQWQVVIAPHHVNEEMLAKFEARLRESAVPCARWSAMGTEASVPNGLRSKGTEASVPMASVLVDTMGQLAEIYGTADAAFVGGALHHQVHNVLEPACHGLALAMGPFYKNSPEAIHLAQAGLATVVKDAAELADWWQRLTADLGQATGEMVKAVAALSGASERIMAEWQTLWAAADQSTGL